MKPGFGIGTGTKPGVETVPPGGQHGYSPTHPEMRSSFLIAGPGIQRGVNLGEVDMRGIAPTLAKVMGGSLGTADLPPLNIFSQR